MNKCITYLAVDNTYFEVRNKPFMTFSLWMLLLQGNQEGMVYQGFQDLQDLQGSQASPSPSAMM